MTAESTPDARFEAMLSSFLFLDGEGEDTHQGFANDLYGRMPATNAGDGKASRDDTMAQLAEREKLVHGAIRDYYAEQMAGLARANLEDGHSYRILHQHTRLIDALHRLAFTITLDELPALVKLRILDGERELAFNRTLLPQKEANLAGLNDQMSAILETQGDSPEQRDYYQSIRSSVEKEIAACREVVEMWEKHLPLLNQFEPKPEAIRNRIVLFARGGYGRAELSLESDLDTGYCLDTHGLADGEITIYRDIILRVESLLAGSGLQTAHQYFEMDEDLSRFTDPETLHTIPSILEGRALAGNPKILETLKSRFYEILPFEVLVKRKLEEYEAQAPPALTSMNLKDDFGGLRTLQTPLWIYGISRRAASFQMAELVAEAHRSGHLSPWEAGNILTGLELLHDLRNFVGAAREHYNSREAQEHLRGPLVYTPGRWHDTMARLYLFSKGRFATIDDLDRARLHCIAEVQRVSRSILSRVLDRVSEQRSGCLDISVHLGRKEITSVAQAGGARDAGDHEKERSPVWNEETCLELMVYSAETGYSLGPEVADRMNGAIESLQNLPGTEDFPHRKAQWSRIMAAPHAHMAVQAMFEAGDSLPGGGNTLIGRFIPECDGIYFLLRDIGGETLPLHRHLINSLNEGQRILDWMGTAYPEWRQLLQAPHILAFKWALFLHGMGRLDSPRNDPSHSADMAVEALEELGYDDQSLLERVRLLVQHHESLVRLVNTVPYTDQVLAEYFELAERDIVNGILLFAANLAIVRAHHKADDTEARDLEGLFDEAARILAETRGIPSLDTSLELINDYLANKKKDLALETRKFRLMHRMIATGLDAAVLEPLRSINGKEADRVAQSRQTLELLQRKVMVSAQSEREIESLSAKLMQELSTCIGAKSLWALTGEDEGVLSWFFSAFPNRYLLRVSPQNLARQLVKFADFQSAPVLSDVVADKSGSVEGILIFTRGIVRSHTRVAYALSLKRIEIHSGKVNRVDFGGGDFGFCYYFQVTTHADGEELHPRDIEAIIRDQASPELSIETSPAGGRGRGTRIEFLGDDGKGYQVERVDGEYRRRVIPLKRIRVLRRDEPFLFYKISRVFDHYGIELQQSLITTTGNQVVDHFYLKPEDYAALENSDFEENLIAMMDSGFSGSR